MLTSKLIVINPVTVRLTLQKSFGKIINLFQASIVSFQKIAAKGGGAFLIKVNPLVTIGRSVAKTASLITNISIDLTKSMGKAFWYYISQKLSVVVAYPKRITFQISQTFRTSSAIVKLVNITNSMVLYVFRFGSKVFSLVSSQRASFSKQMPRVYSFLTGVTASVSSSRVRSFLIVQEIKTTFILFFTKLKALIQKAAILLVGG